MWIEWEFELILSVQFQLPRKRCLAARRCAMGICFQ